MPFSLENIFGSFYHYYYCLKPGCPKWLLNLEICGYKTKTSITYALFFDRTRNEGFLQ